MGPINVSIMAKVLADATDGRGFVVEGVEPVLLALDADRMNVMVSDTITNRHVIVRRFHNSPQLYLFDAEKTNPVLIEPAYFTNLDRNRTQISRIVLDGLDTSKLIQSSPPEFVMAMDELGNFPDPIVPPQSDSLSSASQHFSQPVQDSPSTQTSASSSDAYKPPNRHMPPPGKPRTVPLPRPVRRATGKSRNKTLNNVQVSIDEIRGRNRRDLSELPDLITPIEARQQYAANLDSLKLRRCTVCHKIELNVASDQAYICFSCVHLGKKNPDHYFARTDSKPFEKPVGISDAAHEELLALPELTLVEQQLIAQVHIESYVYLRGRGAIWLSVE